MGNVLAFSEFSGAALKSSALANLSFARDAAAAHGGEVIIALIGKGAGEAAAAAAKFAPKVVVVDDAALEHALAETYAPILARLVGEHGVTVLTATATSVGKDVIPRAAALLDAGQASDISGLVSGTQFKRPILAGNAYSTVEISTPVIAVTVRQSEFPPAAELGS